MKVRVMCGGAIKFEVQKKETPDSPDQFNVKITGLGRETFTPFRDTEAEAEKDMERFIYHHALID
jgi:hypothetical protein